MGDRSGKTYIPVKSRILISAKHVTQDVINYSSLYQAIAKTLWIEGDISQFFFTNFVSDKTRKDLRKMFKFS